MTKDACGNTHRYWSKVRCVDWGDTGETAPDRTCCIYLSMSIQKYKLTLPTITKLSQAYDDRMIHYAYIRSHDPIALHVLTVEKMLLLRKLPDE